MPQIIILWCLIASITYMKPIYRIVLIELAWLAIAGSITILIVYPFLGTIAGNYSLDINLHDTYFVIKNSTIVTLLFTFVVFLVFFIKELFKKFSRPFSNSIIMLSGLLLLAQIILAEQMIVTLSTRIITPAHVTAGWHTTIDPPSYALPKLHPFTIENASVISNTIIAIAIVQLSVTCMLLYVSYKWGTARTKKKEMNQA